MSRKKPDALQTIGTNLRELRKIHGLTQIELAEQLEVSDATVSTWEQGTVDMGAKRLAEIAWRFGVTPDILYRPDGYKEVDPHTLKLRRYLAAEGGNPYGEGQ